ncbi:MAG: hypothetical protein PUB29_02260 [Bacteroidales bacterium]|nr:hypothetical protein [Bacteroidales bacterium]
MILAVVMMAGCEVGEGELMKTKTGHLMYLGWTDDINGILFNIVEPAFNLNAWVQAPEDQKPEILRKHFYSNTVIDVLSDHTWRIRVDGTTASLRVVLVNGTSLAETGAKMRLLYSKDYDHSVWTNTVFVLENKGDGLWNFYSEDGQIHLQFTLGTSEVPESLSETPLKIAGAGTFTERTVISHCSGDVCSEETIFTYLSYDIQQPFEASWTQDARRINWTSQFNRNDYFIVFSAGKVQLQALDEEGQGNTAVVTLLNTEEIEIEMDGIVQRRKI